MSSSGPVAEAADWRAVAAEQRKELRLWKKFSPVMDLIKTQSEVYHAAVDGADADEVSIYPFIAAYGQSIGDAEPSDAEIDRRMRLVELLMVVDKAPEPGTAELFHLYDWQLALCVPLTAHISESENAALIELLEQMHAIAEYLQLDKRLSANMQRLIKAEQLRLGTARKSVNAIRADKHLAPLLKAAVDRLVATEVPKTLAEPTNDASSSRPGLHLRSLFGTDMLVDAALGLKSFEVVGTFASSADQLVVSQLHFLFGQGLADRTFSSEVVSAAKMSRGLGVFGPTAITVVEALVVLGKGQAALQLTQGLSISTPRFLKPLEDRLILKPAKECALPDVSSRYLPRRFDGRPFGF